MAGNGGESYDITSLLSGNDRDYVIRNNGDQVKIADLKDKTLGLYFSAHWSRRCHKFTPKLIETYNNLLAQSKPFEIIFISDEDDGGDDDDDEESLIIISDDDDDDDDDDDEESLTSASKKKIKESLTSYFSQMPWLAIPFSDSDALERINKAFKIKEIPTLVMIDANGNLLTGKAVGIREYKSYAYPFTAERFAELKEAEKQNQTIRSILVRGECDYVLSSKGEKVPVSELEGKYVGLYFNDSRMGEWEYFTPILSQMREKLKQNGENFEIVTVLLDVEESFFNDAVTKLPFLVIPFEDIRIEKLMRYFDCTFPTLVMIGSDGKTLNNNCADLIKEHGVDSWEGFPFTQEKMGILEEKARAKLEQQTLESLLVIGEFDYVVGKDGTKIPVSDLVGKTIILYFSSYEWGPCHAFLLKLIKEYKKIKSKYPDSFEIIFVSSDPDEYSYKNLYSSMPWLALPLYDPRKSFLEKTFKIRGSPYLIAIGPSGKTVSTDVRMLLTLYGADAYPFTDERIKELQDEIENVAKGWPEKIKLDLDDLHESVLTKCGTFTCDGCKEMGSGWLIKCKKCNLEWHPTCAHKADGEDMG